MDFLRTRVFVSVLRRIMARSKPGNDSMTFSKLIAFLRNVQAVCTPRRYI